MPIEDRCTGDKVYKQTPSHAIGASGGDVRVFADTGSAIDCCVQTPRASEIRDYQTRGMRLTHWVFFSSDPGLTPDNRLRWTIRASNTLTTPIYLRVLDCYSEGRPGEDMLWVADCEHETTRSEQA